MKLITHPIFFRHEVDEFCLERPERLRSLIDSIPTLEIGVQKALIGERDKYVILAKNGKRYVTLVHPIGYQTRIEEICQELMAAEIKKSGDNCFSAQTYRAACFAVGAAVQAARLAQANEPALALVRPPGHHAKAEEYGGFCVFNNVAIATEYLLTRGNEERVLILDVDLHHGDGTAEYIAGKEDALLVSIGHEALWPYLQSTNDNVHLIGLPEGSGNEKFIDVLETRVKQIIDEFGPKIIAVSLGTDAHGSDANKYRDNFGGGLNLTEVSYRHLWDFLSRSCIPYFAVLEGGYTAGSLVDGVSSFIEKNK